MIPVCNARPGTLSVSEALADYKPSRLASARLKRLYRRATDLPAPDFGRGAEAAQ